VIVLLLWFLSIVYNVTTGYGRFYTGLKDFLLLQPSVSSQIEVVPLEDRMTTGNFEVTVKKTGQVLHSKRHAGQGKAQTEAERLAILHQIQEILQEEQ
jgi:hypothetical protein